MIMIVRLNAVGLGPRACYYSGESKITCWITWFPINFVVELLVLLFRLETTGLETMKVFLRGSNTRLSYRLLDH